MAGKTRSRGKNQPEVLNQPREIAKIKISSGPVTNDGMQMPSVAIGHRQIIAQRIFPQRRDDAGDEPEHQREAQSLNAKFDRDRQRAGEQFIHTPAEIFIGRSEVAVKNQPPHVIEILLPNGFVQAVVGFDLLL